ncbi:hypothetical protein FACS1894206_08890 [Deltaproteobacteria bacterium]|nr:hypothetical protein FACS1894206_08890 [Deltaproteobacteria bacterium]
MDKKALRKAFREKRRCLEPQKAMAAARKAQEFVLSDTRWQKAASIGLYLPFRNEIDTSLLLGDAFETGKRVFLPYTQNQPEGAMLFLPFEKGQQLAPNRFGIPEVVLPQETEDGAPELVIVPGVVFDRAGYRIGSGGGFYDRWFAKSSPLPQTRIGLAYAFQLVAHLPAQEWDIPMHAIATEKGLTWL